MSTVADAYPPTNNYEAMRQRHLRALAAKLPAELERVTWPLEQVQALRDQRLRALVRTAKERSPWHARRLHDVNPDTLRGHDLSALPPMTKVDLMDNWDEIVTDRRLTLDVAEAHLAHVDEYGPSYLLNEYHVVCSGGSSGRRGVFVWDFEGWLQAGLTSTRRVAWMRQREPAPGPQRVAQVTTARAIHMGTAMSRTFAGPAGSTTILPVTLPMGELVTRLNALQPTALVCYPTALHYLAMEARAGRLNIAPQAIASSGEPLLPDARRVIEAIFGVLVSDSYACSEAWIMASSYPGVPGLSLNEDSAVYEFLDRGGHPAAHSDNAARFLITNVINHALPLIRYELSDEVVLLEGPDPGPWTGRRIAPVGGRLDDRFLYAHGVEVLPHIFRSALGRVPEITAYQVRQTPHGADIAVEVNGAADLTKLGREITAALVGLGLDSPEIVVQRVGRLERLAIASKLKSFIPLPNTRV